MEHMMTLALKRRVPKIKLLSVKDSVGFYTRLGFTRTKPLQKTKKRSRSIKHDDHDEHFQEMELSVLLYFGCFLRSVLDSDQQKYLRAIFD